jgi:hypothetical protein
MTVQGKFQTKHCIEIPAFHANEPLWADRIPIKQLFTLANIAYLQTEYLLINIPRATALALMDIPGLVHYEMSFDHRRSTESICNVKFVQVCTISDNLPVTIPLPY